MSDELIPDDSLVDIETLLASDDDDVPAMDPDELEQELADTHRALNELTEGRNAADLLALNVSVQREIDIRRRLIEELTTLYKRTEQLKGSETERRSVQEAWEASEDRYRLLVEHASDAIFQIDLYGKIVFANRKTDDLLGYDPSDMVGRHFIEFVSPESRRKALKMAVLLFRKGDDEAGDTRIELGFSKKDGSSRYGDLNVNLIHRDKEVIGALAMIRDTRGQPAGTKHRRQTPA